MNVNEELRQIISNCVKEARAKNIEYVTPEQLLSSIIQIDSIKESLKSINVEFDDLEFNLDVYVNKLKRISSITNNGTTNYTVDLQNILEKAEEHMMQSEKEEIDIYDIIIVCSKSKTYAGDCLRDANFDELKFEQAIVNEKLQDGANEKSLLKRFSIDLIEKAKNGEIMPLIGRDNEIKRTIQILARKNKNNPIHVGDAGVGKTAITEGLAKMIYEDKIPVLKDYKIYSLNISSLIAGTKYRGEFEARMDKLMKELVKQDKVILYIDEIHTIVGAGATGESTMDVSNILKPYLTSGKIKIIGSTTYEEYKKSFIKDKALTRRFQKIDIKEPSSDETLKILKGLKSHYEKFHGVSYSDEALNETIYLSNKYQKNKRLPDKAIDIIDESGANAKLKNQKIVNKIDIDDTFYLITKIPIKTLTSTEKDKIKELPITLKQNIFGQNKAIDEIIKSIKYYKSGLADINNPMSFLLIGPPAVGKTEVCKQLSETMNIPLIRFDMSEYQEEVSVNKLIGSSAGYVGYEQGGLLTEKIKQNPYCILLLDEIEKAHPNVYNTLLQVMDYGTLTDNQGEKIDFRNVIVIMTSNIGTKEVGKSIIGFGDKKTDNTEITNEFEQSFSPEFRSRLKHVILFNSINKDILLKISKREINKLQNKLNKNNIKIKVTNKCYNYIINKVLDKSLGARDIIKIIEQEIKSEFVDIMLDYTDKKYVVDIKNNKISIDEIKELETV